MDIVDFISKYQKVLNNRIEDISVSITSGRITDIEDYRARVGEIQGVTFALDDRKALLTKAKCINDVDSGGIRSRATRSERKGRKGCKRKIADRTNATGSWMA